MSPIDFSDRILRATAADGFIKMSVITARATVEQARVLHHCSPTASAALGRALCAASMLGNMMKEEDGSLTLRIDGGGPIGGITAVSDTEGFVRGRVGDPSVDLPLRQDGKLNVGGAVGTDGMLTLSRDLGLREPYIGSVELVSGEIAEDVTAYLLESEQVPSACALGVLVDTDTSIRAAGGFIVQLMPFADPGLVDSLEENIFMMDQLTTILDEDGPEEVFRQVLKGIDYHIAETQEVGWRCPCSRERVEKAVRCIDEQDLQEMIDDGRTVDISCQFCTNEYHFSPAELSAILESKHKVLEEE